MNKLLITLFTVTLLIAGQNAFGMRGLDIQPSLVTATNAFGMRDLDIQSNLAPATLLMAGQNAFSMRGLDIQRNLVPATLVDVRGLNIQPNLVPATFFGKMCKAYPWIEVVSDKIVEQKNVICNTIAEHKIATGLAVGTTIGLLTFMYYYRANKVKKQQEKSIVEIAQSDLLMLPNN